MEWRLLRNLIFRNSFFFFFLKKENHEANLVYFLNIPSSAVKPE